jgi:hypothetical protein
MVYRRSPDGVVELGGVVVALPGGDAGGLRGRICEVVAPLHLRFRTLFQREIVMRFENFPEDSKRFARGERLWAARLKT